jgi:hypothetical protein
MTYKRCFNDNLKRVTKGLKPRIHDFLFFGSFVVVLALAVKRGNSVAHFNEWTFEFRLKCSIERVSKHNRPLAYLMKCCRSIQFGPKMSRAWSFEPANYGQ